MPEYTLILHLHRAVCSSLLYPIFNKFASEGNRETSSIRQFLAILNRRHNLSPEHEPSRVRFKTGLKIRLEETRISRPKSFFDDITSLFDEYLKNSHSQRARTKSDRASDLLISEDKAAQH
jgi:hypothetical protein